MDIPFLPYATVSGFRKRLNVNEAGISKSQAGLLTTAKKLTLISLAQSLRQVEPKPWMMILMGREALKLDSATAVALL